MIKTEANSNLSKSKGLVFLEYVLFALCLCIIALRTTFTESPSAQSANQSADLGDTVYSLSISAVLILSFVCWLIWSFCSGRFLYRFTAIETGLCLFIPAAVVAGFAASNKRAAITDSVILLAPILMAVLLIQILDSQAKIKLLLAVVAALGIVSAYRCSSQFFAGNKEMIKFYKEHPDEVLARQNITPNTLKHWQFKHRLYSKDVSGFFTTGNSAGSFALLASFAGIALFIEKLRNRKSSSPRHRPLIICGFAAATIIWGLVITHSKGAIIASLMAAAMLVLYLLAGHWLKNHKKIILIACLLLGVGGVCVVVRYGLTHGRLPGGNSMLVRWQYWHASARMYADHPLTGVGAGNFSQAYLHYKPAAAMEEVSDPHNFLLSILTQYGPLGLIGFLAMVFIPLWKIIFPRPASLSTNIHPPKQDFRKLAISFIIVISAGLLLIRPMLIPIKTGSDIDITMDVTTYLTVMIYVIIVLYVAPVVVFVAGFWSLTAEQNGNKHDISRYTFAVLFCAVCGFLIHNLIDFAIFEPGVLTTFWAIMACLIALDFHQNPRPQSASKPHLLVRILTPAAGVALAWAYFNYALIPTAKSTNKIRQANQAASEGEFVRAHNLLAAAAEDDSLSPIAPSLNGGLYLHRFQVTGRRNWHLLDAAKNNLLQAISRNNADFRNFEKLTSIYTDLAKLMPQKKNDLFEKAYTTINKAVERYPGCARLRIKLAQVAERLGKTETAIIEYKKAVEIEKSFRRQFRQMYPAEKIISRVGEERYENAKQKIKQLSKQPTP